ncbi:ArsR/SmtB family transcription factor [Haloechinothrix halophila]|uniref:ArsR/SmtB family transcription factor n=1 Tax=Haloechinothrix halophila TaxID=1069073 RepID=UPI001E29FE15|nr:winged helix-turn-helix domain-containing protein [Haloechinothrix halophila]
MTTLDFGQGRANPFGLTQVLLVDLGRALVEPELEDHRNHSWHLLQPTLTTDVSVRAELSSGYVVLMERNPLAVIGSLLADDTRAGLLTALMDGRAHTNSELARHLQVSASTVSEHLRKLRDSGMVAVEAQGRHRYFRIADHRIADMLESLGATALSVPAPPVATAVAFARTCYDHLAGEVAVRIYGQLVDDRYLIADDEQVHLTTSGLELFSDIGVDVAPQASPRPLVRSCLDWSQRRHHLAGAVGAGLLDTMLLNRWLVRQDGPRKVRFTRSGRIAVSATFGIQV